MLKFKKIKDSGYLPTRTENADFFNWVEGSQVDPSIVIYKNDVINLNASTDEEKINKYFEGLMRWNGRVGKIERLKRNMSTQEKLDLLIKYKDDYQYIDSIEINNTSDIKSNVNNNEVELAYKVTNVSYEGDRPRRIDQLLYLDKYSDRNVSIYQDGSTIYFCSTGSRTELSGQAAEDWLQSNIAILIGVSTNTLSPRFSEEQKVLNEIVMVFNPAIVIFTGHSLGGRLSNELFIYSIEKYKFQGFSISFNAGSVMGSSVDFTKKFNTEYINNRMLQFHVNYDPLSTGNMMGTVVELPAHYDLSHKLSNFSDFDWTHYENFVQSGLQFTNPFNPVDEIVAEDQPVTEPDPVNDTDKKQKLMELFSELWDINENDRLTSQTYTKTQEYYKRNSALFNNLDTFSEKEPLFIRYIGNRYSNLNTNQKEEIYNFFNSMYNKLSVRRSAEPDKPIEQPIVQPILSESPIIISDNYDLKPEDQKPILKNETF